MTPINDLALQQPPIEGLPRGVYRCNEDCLNKRSEDREDVHSKPTTPPIAQFFVLCSHLLHQLSTQQLNLWVRGRQVAWFALPDHTVGRNIKVPVRTARENILTSKHQQQKGFSQHAIIYKLDDWLVIEGKLFGRAEQGQVFTASSLSSDHCPVPMGKSCVNAQSSVSRPRTWRGTDTQRIALSKRSLQKQGTLGIVNEFSQHPKWIKWNIPAQASPI